MHLVSLSSASLARSYKALRPTALESTPKSVEMTTRNFYGKLLSVSVGSIAAGLLMISPATAGNLELGEEVFSNTCAACHTGGQNVVQVEKTLQRSALEQYLEGGFSEASIVRQATYGKNAMPAFADRLSEEEIEAVAAYVYNQAANDLW